MMITLHKSLTIGALLAGIAVLAGVMIADGKQKRTQVCSSLKVEFADSLKFVSTEDVRQCLDKMYGSYIGQRIDSVDLNNMETLLDARSAVLKSEAYITRDGTLHVLISQRKPVIRFQKGDDGFYADDRGFIFPLQQGYSSDVPVIDGCIPLWHDSGYRGLPQGRKEAEWMRDILEMTKIISQDKVWRNSIVQISVRQDGDIILIPREGDERFIFGNPTDVRKKLGRMAKYYEYIRPAVGEDFYKTVNVKYDGQVICRRDRR